MSLIIKLGVLLAILVDNGNCQIFDQCPYGTFYQNGVCLPNSVSYKCPPDMIYKDGLCQYKTGTMCPSGATYINGVCIKQNAPSCNGNLQQCTSSTNCQANNQNRCPHKEICPANYVLFQGSCVSSSIANCPFGTRLQSGHCIKESICPPNSHLENNVCVQDSVVPVMDLSCPYGSHLEGMECVLDPNVVCPVGMTFKNKTCSKACADNSFLVGGTCAQCPANSEYSNGQCVQCKIGMILNNARCSCPPSEALLNGKCVTVNVEKCLEKEMYLDGKCVLRYCYANQCCNTSHCNNCFETCNQIIITTHELSSCHQDCINNILPTIPATPAKIKQNVTLPNLSKSKKPPIIVNITNIANSTDQQNVLTTRNSSNFNNINLESNTSSLNSQPKKSKKSEPCCMITDPRKCTNVDGNAVCYHRKHHVCGSECNNKKTHFHVPASEVHKNIKTEFIPFMPQPQKAILQPFLYPQPAQQPIIMPQQMPQFMQQMYVPQTIPKQTTFRQQYYQPSFSYPQRTLYNPQSMGSSFYMPNQGFAAPELQYQQYPYMQNYQQYQQDITPYDCLSCATVECRNLCHARGFKTNYL